MSGAMRNGRGEKRRASTGRSAAVSLAIGHARSRSLSLALLVQRQKSLRGRPEAPLQKLAVRC